MNISAHYQSITKELEALKNRVRYYIDTHHWLTDGEWKESVLRSLLGRFLPDSLRIGRGFILTDDGPTTQCDIIIYRGDCPVLFREGELVFLTPNAVLAIIEVKSRISTSTFEACVKKLAAIGRKLGPHASHCALSLFSYDSDIPAETLKMMLTNLHSFREEHEQPVRYINLGCSTFIRWWSKNPNHCDGNESYNRWHVYDVRDQSAGYFISNIIDWLCPNGVGQASRYWYPEESKEMRLQFSIPA